MVLILFVHPSIILTLVHGSPNPPLNRPKADSWTHHILPLFELLHVIRSRRIPSPIFD